MATGQDGTHGAEVEGERITVYTLLPHFLDPATTEADLCRIYDLRPEQVASARAYILNHPETVLADHLRIEARLAEGNPPDVIESARKTYASLLDFKEWLAQRDPSDADRPSAPASLPTFKQWLRERESRPGAGS